jgi:hypothetical protein
MQRINIYFLYLCAIYKNIFTVDLYTWIPSLIIHEYRYVAIHNVSFYTVESCVQKLFVTPRDIFLKVHKREKFFVSDFEFFTIL